MDFYNVTDEMELGAYLLAWLDMYKERIAHNTYRGYMVNICKHTIPYLGTIKLCDLKPMMIQQLYSQLLKEGLSGTTCVYVHNTLRKALNSALRMEIINRNPAQLVEPPRKSKHKIAPLNLVQIQTLIGACKVTIRRPVGLAVLLALLLGLRRGEVLGLQWRDFDFELGTVEICRTVTPDKAASGGLAVSDVKTDNSNRTLVLADELLILLKQYREIVESNTEGFVFWCRGSLMRSVYLTKYFKRMLVDYDLPSIRFHDLRHTNATLMLHNHVPAKIVSSMLGHSGIGITLDTYTHVMVDMQEPAVSVVQKLLTGK